MKLGAVSLAYNEETLVRGCIESLKPFVDRHIFLISEKPYYGEPEPPDRTEEIARSLGAKVVKGNWPLDHHQRNTGIALLQDCDWIICTDVDMWLTHDTVRNIISEIAFSEAKAYTIPQIGYWKDIDHALVGDDFKPVIAIRPSVRFTHIGNINTHWEVMPDVCHHLAWCEPKNILKKVKTYPHAPEFNGELWYETHYKNWKESDKVAVLPNKTFVVERKPLPDELRSYI
jgi:glycosyltransferase involved in cell wall biosynthesis